MQGQSTQSQDLRVEHYNSTKILGQVAQSMIKLIWD